MLQNLPFVNYFFYTIYEQKVNGWLFPHIEVHQIAPTLTLQYMNLNSSLGK